MMLRNEGTVIANSKRERNFFFLDLAIPDAVIVVKSLKSGAMVISG